MQKTLSLKLLPHEAEDNHTIKEYIASATGSMPNK